VRFAVIYGSVRSERQGIRAVRWIASVLRERGHEVDVVDPMAMPLPMLDRMYKEYDEGAAPEAMESIARIFRSVDGFVAVSGEYNHAVPPALKNLLDHFQAEYLWRPAAILTYSAGHTGGARAQVQLRAILGELGLVTIPAMLDVPRVAKAIDEDGTDLEGHLTRSVDRYCDELEWYARALARGRDAGVPYE